MPKGKPFKKGEGGRPKGAVNKVTRTVKDALHAAFYELQDDPEVKLVEWGKKNPTEFYKLAAKLIPTEITATVDTNTIKEIIIEPVSKAKG